LAHPGAEGGQPGGWQPNGPESDQTQPLPLDRRIHFPMDQTVRLPLPPPGMPPPGMAPPGMAPAAPRGHGTPPPAAPSSPAVPPPPAPGGTKRKRRRGVLVGVVATAAALVLALAAVVAVRPKPLFDLLGGNSSDRVLDPLPSDPPPSPVLAGATGDAPMPTPEGIQSALAPLVADSVLGKRVNVSVVDVATGKNLYGHGQDTPTLPASTNKLTTAVAVLTARGPMYRIPTKAVAGRSPGEVVLVGGGDPTLAVNGTGSYPGAARLDQLAAQVKQALGGAAATKVTVDSSLFSGPVFGPWDGDIAHNGYAGPAVALMTDGARVNPKQVKPPAARYDAPDLAAGKAFARALGVPAQAVAAVAKGTAPAGGRQLGQVESMPIGRMVEIMLADSDNVIAEMLARQVALAKDQPASYAGAATAVKATLTGLGLPASEIQLSDGSGFSRADKLTPSVLTDLLRLAASPKHPELHGVFSGLPVAGWSGTLQERYRKQSAGSQAGAGMVRAKTGTLRGVNAIAGIVVDADGRLLTFAVMADAVQAGQEAAQDALDRVAAKLATCGCG
jgi:D-alanyl-D-alanine carboxypeptidase/D-alanyl-D-alanine-endopeptidase (penicillin-binding protein 4)